MTNEDLGYNGFFEAGRHEAGLGGFPVARVIAAHKEAYTVKNADGEFFAKVTGKHIHTAESREEYPAVGDWVVIETPDEEHAVIKAVLPRKSLLKRSRGDATRGEKETQVIAANVDVAFVVESVDRDYSLNRFERYCALAEEGGVTPAIILNKTDLLPEEELREKTEELRGRFPDIDIIPTSTVRGDGLAALTGFIRTGRTYCFLGSSGVGKSSLINTLLHDHLIPTGDISARSGRGKHVTTSRNLYLLREGGMVIDNPGMREVGMTGAGGVEGFFDEMAALSAECKFPDCSHTHEPGCAVRAAVESGSLDTEQYANYLNLKKEAEFQELSDQEKRDRGRRFGKFLKHAKKDLKKSGHPDF